MLFAKEYHLATVLFTLLIVINTFIIFYMGEAYWSSDLQIFSRFIHLMSEFPFGRNLQAVSDFPSSSIMAIAASCILSTAFSIVAFCFCDALIDESLLLHKRGFLAILLGFLFISVVGFSLFMRPETMADQASRSGRLFRTLAHSEYQFLLLVSIYFSALNFLALNQLLFRAKAFILSRVNRGKHE